MDNTLIDLQNSSNFSHSHSIIANYYMACVCSRYTARSNWPILGYFSSVMRTGRLRDCKNKAKLHIINNVLTANLEYCNFLLIALPGFRRFLNCFCGLTAADNNNNTHPTDQPKERRLVFLISIGNRMNTSATKHLHCD